MIFATNQEPRWLTVLRQQCAQKSQQKVANDIGYSAATVNQLLHGKYPSNTRRVESAIRGAYLGESVNCPILGEIPINRCIENQRQPFAATNPIRVQLYRACRSNCPNNQTGEKP